MKMAREFSKRIENTVGKGEIARYEQFLLIPTVFSKFLYYRHVKTGLVWERVKKAVYPSAMNLDTLYQISKTEWFNSYNSS